MEISDDQLHRYARHIILDEVGEEGQARLLAAKVLVVGAGGLGTPLIQYLAAAGIGTLGIVDDDVVELSNLQRQVIFTSDQLGRAKVDCAVEAVAALNPEIQVRPRSGLALKHGVTVANSPGTIDADYRGEVQVILLNTGPAPFSVARGMRIAQLVVAPVARAAWTEVAELPESGRGAGGFGSTGTG